MFLKRLLMKNLKISHFLQEFQLNKKLKTIKNLIRIKFRKIKLIFLQKNNKHLINLKKKLIFMI